MKGGVREEIRRNLQGNTHSGSFNKWIYCHVIQKGKKSVGKNFKRSVGEDIQKV